MALLDRLRRAVEEQGAAAEPEIPPYATLVDRLRRSIEKQGGIGEEEIPPGAVITTGFAHPGVDMGGYTPGLMVDGKPDPSRFELTDDERGPYGSPTKEEAINEFKTKTSKGTIKFKLQKETKAPEHLRDEINKMIDDSIDQMAEEETGDRGPYQPGGCLGPHTAQWTWGASRRGKCEEGIRRIYADKLKTEKKNIEKIARVPNMSHQAGIATRQFLGGRRKKYRRKKGKYTLKKRKSIKRIRKKKRGTKKTKN